MLKKPLHIYGLSLLLALALIFVMAGAAMAAEEGSKSSLEMTMDKDLHSAQEDAEAYKTDIDKRLLWLEARMDAIVQDMDKLSDEGQQQLIEALAVVARERQQLREDLAKLDAKDPMPEAVDAINMQLVKLQKAYEEAKKAVTKTK
ncbi:hypothetical protein [Oceanidesulfovibrio marinus]|uniref:Uncharacterized protein n=1 Tax=Oceanidesulfovibrio marinus TaxID=370038 RepID=A0ABX6NJM2_9BACT|nr:hypothetical protein [Oceanidesulfovibrio marinus]QJT10783.1 hypothetical protein E8L03_18490 [Oceanidesulfovibrio marinus]